MLSLNGWLDGITALLVVVFCVVFSLFFYFRARKINTPLLKKGAGMGLFVGLLWLGPTTDFLFVLFTEKHISDFYDITLYGLLSYIWVGPAFLCGVYIGTQLLVPDKKRSLFAVFFPLAIIFEIILIIDVENTFSFTLNEGDLIDSQFIYFSPAFFFIATFLVFILLFNGFGSLLKVFQSTGDIRKRFSYLSYAFIIFIVVAVFDAFIDVSTAGFLFVIRLLMISCAWTLYLGLKS